MKPTEVTLQRDGEQWTEQDVVDAMVLNGKLRYATRTGRQDSLEGGEIHELITNGEPYKLVLKTKDGNYETKNVQVAGYDGGFVYVAWPGRVDRFVGKIIRVRSQMV